MSITDTDFGVQTNECFDDAGCNGISGSALPNYRQACHPLTRKSLGNQSWMDCRNLLGGLEMLTGWALIVSVCIGEQKTKKCKQLFGINPGKGGGQICLCVAFSLGKVKHGKHIMKISRKLQKNAGTVPGKPRENSIYVSACLALSLDQHSIDLRLHAVCASRRTTYGMLGVVGTYPHSHGDGHRQPTSLEWANVVHCLESGAWARQLVGSQMALTPIPGPEARNSVLVCFVGFLPPPPNSSDHREKRWFGLRPFAELR